MTGDLANIMARHEKIVLMLSGGKDSMACLFLLRPWWDKITVLFVNTGDAFPEMLDFMRGIRAMVPRFYEVIGDVRGYIEKFGLPSDIVPVNYSHIGQSVTRARKTKINAYLQCCSDNMWLPAQEALKELGATLVIRGQKKSDNHSSPIASGHVENGVEYLFPIEDWTDAAVFAFLAEQPDFKKPEFYDIKHSSLDCMSCTAYCADQKDKFQYMHKRHPRRYEQVLQNLTAIKAAIEAEAGSMNEILGGA